MRAPARRRRGAGVLYRSVERDRRRPRRATARAGGGCSARSAGRFDELADDFLRPMLRVPRAPAARWPASALPTLLPATLLARLFAHRARRGRCSAGVAAHAFRPLTAPMSSAIGVALGTAGAPLRLAGRRGRLGGDHRRDGRAARRARRQDRDRRPRRLARRARRPRTSSMLDVAPARRSPASLGDRMPPRVARALPPLPPRPGRVQGRLRGRGRRAVDARGRAPGRHRPRRRQRRRDRRGRARRRARGGCPSGPFVLVGQQYLADPQPLGRRHPPAVRLRARARRLHRRRDRGDRSAQIERFAPGFRERIVGRHVAQPPRRCEAYNPNYVGGDIVTGANDPRQLRLPPARRARPVRHRHPRRVPLLGGDAARRRARTACAATTPPGGAPPPAPPGRSVTAGRRVGAWADGRHAPSLAVMAQTSRSTADLIVECLENEGVTHVFGIPGEENIHWWRPSRALPSGTC